MTLNVGESGLDSAEKAFAISVTLFFVRIPHSPRASVVAVATFLSAVCPIRSSAPKVFLPPLFIGPQIDINCIQRSEKIR